MLLEPLIYITDSGKEIEVPAGYITDFATIPRFLWWALPPDHYSYIKSSVVHDYALTNLPELSKKICDDIFREAMLSEGAPKLRAKVMYLSVKYLGRRHLSIKG